MYINEALVAAAPESEGSVALGKDEGTVNKYVDVLKQRTIVGVVLDFFPSVACVAPDVQLEFCLDALCQMCHGGGLEEGVSPCEGDVEGVVANDVNEFIFGHLFAGIGWPRLGIMAAYAMVGATCKVDGGTQSRTIYRGSLCYINDSQYLHKL